MIRGSAFLMLSALLAAGCAKKVGSAGASCNASADCETSLHCAENVCASSSPEVLSEHDDEPLRGHQLQASRSETPPGDPPTSPTSASDDVTPDECRAFGKRVVYLILREHEGSAEENSPSIIEEMEQEVEQACLKTGRKVEINCALKANSTEELGACQDSAHPLKVAEGAPSEPSCRAFADKIVSLSIPDFGDEDADAAHAMIESAKSNIFSECMMKGTKQVVDCVLLVDSIEELERCGG